jgi:hypothetical protein
MARAINKLKGEPLEMCVKGELRTRENNEPHERDDELTTGTTGMMPRRPHVQYGSVGERANTVNKRAAASVHNFEKQQYYSYNEK